MTPSQEGGEPRPHPEAENVGTEHASARGRQRTLSMMAVLVELDLGVML